MPTTITVKPFPSARRLPLGIMLLPVWADRFAGAEAGAAMGMVFPLQVAGMAYSKQAAGVE